MGTSRIYNKYVVFIHIKLGAAWHEHILYVMATKTEDEIAGQLWSKGVLDPLCYASPLCLLQVTFESRHKEYRTFYSTSDEGFRISLSEFGSLVIPASKWS